jgi:hypothetical protein
MMFDDLTPKTKGEKIMMAILYAVGRLCDAFDKLIGKLPIIFAVVLGFSINALADAHPPMERHDSLCVQLGWPVNCEFTFENGSWDADITITVDEDVDEPNSPLNVRIPAGSLSISIPSIPMELADIFQPVRSTSYWYDQIWLTMQYGQYPCLMPECVIGRANEPGEYNGASEHDLSNLPLTLSRLPWQVASDEVNQRFLAAVKIAKGMPMVTKVKSLKAAALNESNNQATVLRAKVVIQVAKYNTTQ